MLKVMLAATGLAIFGMGCVYHKIESNVRKGYSKKIDRLYIILSSSDSASTKFYNELKEVLISSLEKRSIANSIHVYDMLGLDEKRNIGLEIEAFNPNHVLSIVQTGKETNIYRGLSMNVGASFNLTLCESKCEGAVWRATLKTSVDSSSNGIGSADSVAAKILESLEKDGLILPG